MTGNCDGPWSPISWKDMAHKRRFFRLFTSGCHFYLLQMDINDSYWQKQFSWMKWIEHVYWFFQNIYKILIMSSLSSLSNIFAPMNRGFHITLNSIEIYEWKPSPSIYIYSHLYCTSFYKVSYFDLIEKIVMCSIFFIKNIYLYVIEISS